MKTMPGLLAKVKALKEDGLNAFLWTGGYNVPPTSIMNTVRDAIMFLDEVIGAGEVAISDPRGHDPSPKELAKLAHDCYVGGLLANKAGLLHLHVGEKDTRLDPVCALLDEFNVEPEWLYPTHVERSTRLFDQAVGLAKQGMAIDVDVVEEDLAKWVRRYRQQDGPPDCLTVSSDASLTSPRLLFEQLRDCVLEHGMAIEDVLPLATRNPARILKLEEKGTIEKGKMGDLLIMERDSWEVVHVLSRGISMVKDGELVKEESFLAESNRLIHLAGRKDGKEKEKEKEG
jgi:beta-aspartyl-dipeptidase (metallo-type)